MWTATYRCLFVRGEGCSSCAENIGRHRPTGDQVSEICAALASATGGYGVIYVACTIVIGIGDLCNFCRVKECNSVIVMTETCVTNVNLSTLCACLMCVCVSVLRCLGVEQNTNWMQLNGLLHL